MQTVIFILILLAAVGAIAYRLYVQYQERKLIELVTPIYRGERSERKVILALLKMGVNPKAIFHDLYIRKQNGEYTQIDLAVATSAGIIVIEVKDFGGWIFGNEQQKYWTQVMAYGHEKYRFYNPIMQNNGHIAALRDSLPQNPGIPYFSLIVFGNGCTLKKVTYNLENVAIAYLSSIRGFVSDIMALQPAQFGNKYEIMEVLKQGVANGNNPDIVASQIQSAQNYSHNKPKPSYSYGFNFISFPIFKIRKWYW